MGSEPDPDASPFDRLIGTEWLEHDPDRARVRIAVRPELTQPAGLLHGGVLSSVVESLCSRATFLAVRDAGCVAMGQSLDISFLRPVESGVVTVEARARHRGRSTWVWDAEASDEQGRLCALARHAIAVRPAERG